MRLLLVEDDPMIGDAVLRVLRAAHYAADWVKDGEMADAALRGENYDLVLLDLGLPRQSGLDVLRALRARKSTVPVLIATARDGITDRIAGLDAGADDYVVKPYDTDELLARIRALLRRASGRAEPVYEHMGVSLDPAMHEALVDGKPVNLSAREWAVLEYLLQRGTRVVSKQQIIDAILPWGEDLTLNAVEVYISRVRLKIVDAGISIRTIRGFGYMLEASDA